VKVETEKEVQMVEDKQIIQQLVDLKLELAKVREKLDIQGDKYKKVKLDLKKG
jgi:hypothetical protein